MLLGIDGGGTKTEMVLADARGEVLALCVDAGSNVAELGFEEALRRLTAQLNELLRAHGGRQAPLRAVYAGLSGGGDARTAARMKDALCNALPGAAKIGAGSDSVSGMYACIEEGDGMVVIAGTGSSAFVRRDGQWSQVGGWGYLIDDAGSGFSVGRAALNAALRAHDGRGAETSLYPRLSERLGGPVERRIPEIYAGGKRGIAAHAPLVFAEAAAGDAVAGAIVSQTADELALLLRVCASRLVNPPFRAALTGSLWRGEGLLAQVRARLPAAFVLLSSDLAPVYGAVAAAAELAGCAHGAAFHDLFRISYQRMA